MKYSDMFSLLVIVANLGDILLKTCIGLAKTKKGWELNSHPFL